MGEIEGIHIFIAILTLTGPLKGSLGLHCYVCSYAESGGTEEESSACKYEATLEDAFLQECKYPFINELNLFQQDIETTFATTPDSNTTSDTTSATITSSAATTSKTTTRNPGNIFACATVRADGKRNGKDTKMIHRSCVSIGVSNFQPFCEERAKQVWDDNPNIFSLFVTAVTTSFEKDSQVEGCFCKKDNCTNNGEEQTTSPADEDEPNKGRGTSLVSVTVNIMGGAVILIHSLIN